MSETFVLNLQIRQTKIIKNTLSVPYLFCCWTENYFELYRKERDELICQMDNVKIKLTCWPVFL